MAWIPVLVRFFHSWKDRDNPISLSLCATIVFIIWTSISTVWVQKDKVADADFVYAYVILSLLLGIYSNLAFFWAKKRFQSDRSRKE